MDNKYLFFKKSHVPLPDELEQPGAQEQQASQEEFSGWQQTRPYPLIKRNEN